ncbi:MAG TPA: four helix bundle protein [Anaerohalosphaeraceae bacterium]|nr:four helix bundle protein [Phycisphaerae bacterium]HOK96832.1 four helix bundle protein [Anaerohalosphaeraceae bacterium]HOL31035.1 four helix bundle protein [Anaerohalosphaeraceae bacterium]HOM76687.1 four helix bundle protein [Anaerohalosphaeraceae bacterium]HPC64128.1 four helix bundle protein [Anaerohalosphaeraceae bacterium]
MSSCAVSLFAQGHLLRANLEEANAAPSRADFKCLKEAWETYDWLRLYQSTGIVTELHLKELLKESNEIISILTTIVKESKLKKD